MTCLPTYVALRPVAGPSPGDPVARLSPVPEGSRPLDPAPQLVRLSLGVGEVGAAGIVGAQALAVVGGGHIVQDVEVLAVVSNVFLETVFETYTFRFVNSDVSFFSLYRN